jgi:phytoene dehydrogenase-like protein
VDNLAWLPERDVTLCDVTPFQLVRMATSRLSTAYTLQLAKYRYGPGAFKVDYALRSPIPWKATECFRAASVHLGGSADEIASVCRTKRLAPVSLFSNHTSERREIVDFSDPMAPKTVASSQAPGPTNWELP